VVYMFVEADRARCCLAEVRRLLRQYVHSTCACAALWPTAHTLVNTGCNVSASTHRLVPVTCRDGWLLVDEGPDESPGDAISTAPKMYAAFK
jgi:hypothetical protein